MSDLNEIVVFAKVVETKSFTAAAQQLGLPKSTVSRKVSQLEERLATRLIQRTTRKLSLTEAGQAFYERCARIVTEIALAEQLVTDMQSTPRGLLRVTAPVDLGSFRLAALTARFLKEHPDLHVNLDCTDRVVDLVDEGYDLAVRFGPLNESSLIARRVMGIKFHLYATADYIRNHPPLKDPDDLAEHDLIAFVPSARLLSWTLVGPGDVTAELTPSTRLTSNNLLSVKMAVQAGAGIAWMPEFVHCEPGNTELITLLPDWHGLPGDVFAVYPSVRNLSPKVRVYLDFLSEHLPLPH
ncbi:MAG TPA: LysR family transcriptional regulator [Kofleriaceae bacterium]|nr:LysR family transcriptional regulator [Kofleriaceae bacterium]